MRLERREVTITKDIYIAEDGKEFDMESDCRRYDVSLFKSQLKFFDANFRPTAFNDSVYVHLRAEDVKKLKLICDFYCITTANLDKPGVYMYIEDSDEWRNLNEVIARITEVDHV